MRHILLIISTILIMPAYGQTKADKKAIKEMTEWLESPMELDEKPATISVRDSRKIFWPSQEIVEAYLIDFTDSKGEKYIGFTGPITWTFFGIDYSKLSNDELYNLYTGWFICFYSYQQQKKGDPNIEADRKSVIKKLSESGYQDIDVKSAILMAGETYFEIAATKKDKKMIFVGTEGDLIECDSEVILPLYKLIGEMWEPLKIQ